MENQTRRPHPMIIVAATAVTIASLTAAASFAGWIPQSGATTNQVEPLAAAPSVPAVPAEPPAKAPVKAKTTAPVRQTATREPIRERPAGYVRTSDEQRPATSPSYPINDSGIYVENSTSNPSYANTCRDCGVVETVREVKQNGDGTGLGAIGGGVVGGLLGNQIGGGRGKIVGAVVGAVGGAYAGNEVEKRVRSTTQYEVTVRLENGNTRVFTQSQAPTWQRGDRVRISNGQLVAL